MPVPTNFRRPILDMEFGRFGRQAMPVLPDLDARQQVEGYASTISHPGVAPHPVRGRGRPPRQVSDYRGPNGLAVTREWWRPRPEDEPDLVWLTAAVPAAVDTTFTFAGTSAVLPDNQFPANQATLYANGARALTFDTGIFSPGAWADGDWALEFMPKQTRLPFDGHHRQFEAAGTSGIYRLAAPAAALTAGQPVELKVVLEPVQTKAPHWFAVLERPDVLEVSARTNAEQIEQLQHEVFRLKQSMGMLARRSYTELLPERLPTEDVLIYTDGFAHVHPPDVELLQNGDLLVGFREASEHISCDGKIVTVRSTDGGKTWGDRQVVHESDGTDFRDVSIARLRDGTLLVNDFANNNYDGAGRYVGPTNSTYRGLPGGTYVGRSTDDGHTWTWLTDQPIDPVPFEWVGSSERIIELPSGELLMATYFRYAYEHPVEYGSSLHSSDDGGTTWRYRTTIAKLPGLSLGEPAMIRTTSGRLICIARNEWGATYYQALSDDDGNTWTTPVSSGIPGRANPASLLQLPDGTVLCFYGSRHDIRGLYVVASYDDGATWDLANRRIIRDDFPNMDIGYPSSVLLPDGRALVVYYFNVFERYFVVGSTFRWEAAGRAGA